MKQFKQTIEFTADRKELILVKDGAERADQILVNGEFNYRDLKTYKLPNKSALHLQPEIYSDNDFYVIHEGSSYYGVKLGLIYIDFKYDDKGISNVMIFLINKETNTMYLYLISSNLIKGNLYIPPKYFPEILPLYNEGSNTFQSIIPDHQDYIRQTVSSFKVALKDLALGKIAEDFDYWKAKDDLFTGLGEICDTGYVLEAGSLNDSEDNQRLPGASLTPPESKNTDFSFIFDCLSSIARIAGGAMVFAGFIALNLLLIGIGFTFFGVIRAAETIGTGFSQFFRPVVNREEVNQDAISREAPQLG